MCIRARREKTNQSKITPFFTVSLSPGYSSSFLHPDKFQPGKKTSLHLLPKYVFFTVININMVLFCATWFPIIPVIFHSVLTSSIAVSLSSVFFAQLNPAFSSGIAYPSLSCHFNGSVIKRLDRWEGSQKHNLYDI